MISTIIFDFGNVLAFFDHQLAIDRLLPFSTKTSREIRQIIYHGTLETDYERGALTTAELFGAVRPLGDFSCSLEQFTQAFCEIFSPNQPMLDLVPRLKAAGYRLGLASNTNAAHYAKYRQQFATTLDLFDALGVSHEAGHRKPHQPFFEYVQGLLPGRPDECLFIDDLAENVAAAQDFGWQAIHYTTDDEMLRQALGAQGVRL